MRALFKTYKRCYTLLQHKALLKISYILRAGSLLLSYFQPYVTAMLIDSLTNEHRQSTYKSIELFAAITIARIVLSACIFWLEFSVEKDSRIAVKESLLRHLLYLSPAAWPLTDTARLTETLYSDANNITSIVFTCFNTICDGINIVISSVIIFKISPALSLIMLITLSYTLYYSNRSAKKLSCINQSLRRRTDDNFRLVRDVMMHIREIKAANAAETFIGSFSNDMREIRKSTLNHDTVSWKTNFVGSIMETISLISFLLIGSIMVLSGKMLLPSFIMYSSYSKLFSTSLTRMFELSANSQQLLVSAERVLGLFENKDRPFIINELPTVNRVALSDVTYGYEKNIYIINNLSYTFEKENTYLFVGANGTGKTTLLRLIAGILQPCSGGITYNDAGLSGVNYRCVQRIVSYYMQEDIVYNLSLIDNLLLFEGGDKITRTTVESLCSSFNISDFIQGLPDSYDTKLSEIRGLSYGQARKIILMRTLLKPADIYLFDEPLAGIDQTSLNNISAEIQRLGENKIVIVATHRAEQFPFVQPGNIIYL